MSSRIVNEVAARCMKPRVDPFRVGDTVDVHVRIVEGEKERVQVFTGTVIARRGGGSNEAFTVRRVVEGEGVERVFPLHSPRIERIAVRKTGRARRAKLHFLRERTGKATRLAERRTAREAAPAKESAEASSPEEAAGAGEAQPE
jgi:large subunit ribosomal protein L19